MRKLIFKFLENLKENVRKIKIELKFINYFFVILNSSFLFFSINTKKNNKILNFSFQKHYLIKSHLILFLVNEHRN